MSSNFSVLAEDFQEPYVYELFSSLDVSKLEFEGIYPGGQFGADTKSGDFNKDGIQDIAIASPFASVDGRDWNGQVFVYFGRSGFSIDESNLSNFTADIIVTGKTSGDQLGTSLVAGDFNGDGTDDLAIGAYDAGSFYSYESDSHPGQIYVIYGKNNWREKNLDLAYASPGFAIYGVDDGDAFGMSMESADLNSDKIDDLIISAPFSNSPSKEGSGNVYVFYGKSSGIYFYPPISSNADVIFHGQAKNERFGASLAVGDINGDKRIDLLIGAYFSGMQNMDKTGRVYLYENKKFDSIVNKPTNVVNGVFDNEWFGFSIATGDINADGKADFAISAFPYEGPRSKSRVVIYYGREDFSRKTIRAFSPDFVIENPINGILLGSKVLLEDVDNDGKSEVIVGAPGIGDPVSMKEGNVYIVNIDENKSRYSMRKTEFSSVIHGENSDDWFGFSLDVLDFNGDLKNDLLIGSRYSDFPNRINAGKAFLFFGKGEGFGEKKPASQLDNERAVSRGEFIKMVVDRFDLRNKEADSIQKCLDYKEFCLFNFIAMSSFDGITLEPELVLYPDVGTDNQYYEEINIATMLGAINGYLDEQDSPFRPEETISRVDALKVILGATELVNPKYKFELAKELGGNDKLANQPSYFVDINPKIGYMWWYPRYVNFAVENGIVDKYEYFRPDEPITMKELDDMIVRTFSFINK
ncbi:FG-GAP-like repeat-containing protein [Candidatus Gracilibacteria bacterium]|nr:FG-GAP-like repeat-containing protein [Candidatus Gracilibacteria bacterium]